jgi:hypothetical protein
VTTALILANFSPQVQGYHFTFLSLAILAQLLDIGVSGAVTVFASHEWSRLRLDASGAITGDEEAYLRLRTLARILAKWAVAGGVIVIAVLVATGFLLFGARGDGVDWQAPWLALCGAATLSVIASMALALFDGCNQIGRATGVRLAQAVTGSAVMWLAMSLGAGLWSAAAGMLAGFTVVAFMSAVMFRPFLALCVGVQRASTLSWRRELLPLSWRFAVSWVAAYATYGIITPVTFYYHGAEAAGRMGLTWAISEAVAGASFTWATARFPQFGILAARNDMRTLDRMARRSVLQVTAIGVIGSGCLIAAIFLASRVWPGLPARLLPLPLVALLLAAGVVRNFIGVQTLYARAHKREPTVYVGLAGSALIAIGMIAGASISATAGSVIAYAAVMVLFLLPVDTLVFIRFRQRLRRDQANPIAGA